MVKQHSITVGNRTVDLTRDLLLDEGGNVVALRPRAWLVLQLLATRAGQLVGKHEILDHVWSDCEVTEDSLVQAIGDISLYGRNGSFKRQLTISAPLRVLPKDQFDMSAFLPGVGDCTKLWDWIDKQREEMKSTTLKNVVDL